MAKAYRNLFPQICSFENLHLAWRNARRGKRGRTEVAAFEYQAESNLFRLQEALLTGRYRPAGYRSFYIHEPKRRLISAAPFRDRVVHHALCNVTEPIFERGFIYDSYANRLRKGTHRALNRCTEFMRGYRYVLPCDVQRFFPSIDHAILRGLIARKIADPAVMQLVEAILASGRGVLDGEYRMDWFPGDDLLAASRPRGLPIGNLTSQLWANLYLDTLDHFVKRQLGCRAYLRYVDDFLLFHDDKRVLLEWRSALLEHVAGLRLTLHEDRCQARPVTEGVSFLGFTVFPHHRRLRRHKAVYARRRLKASLALYLSGWIGRDLLKARMQGWVNHARYGNTYGLRRAVMGSLRVPAGK